MSAIGRVAIADTSLVDDRRVAAAATTDRACAWCTGPIPARARRDAETCSKRCRQARHRFVSAVGSAGESTPLSAGQPRRLAYADPPYPGMSARYYSGHPDFAGEVDHAALIEWLSAEHDAWALSTSAAALPALIRLCPAGVRVAAWHRGFRPNKEALGPLNAWEPVIYGGQVLIRRPDPLDASRTTVATSDATRRVSIEDASHSAAATRRASTPRHAASGSATRRGALEDASRGPGEPVAEDLHDASLIAGATRRIDSLVYRAAPRTTDPSRVIGAKPAEFCRWMFELLGATADDDLVDVFPGSGGVSRAWQVYTDKPAIPGGRSW